MTNCCNRLSTEFGLSIFSLQDASGKTMNVEETFHHNSKAIWFLKFLFVGFATSNLIVSLMQSDNMAFWFAFLTQWGILISTVYLFLSFSAGTGWFPTTSNNKHKKATVWIRMVWAFFVASINSQVLISFLFWGTVYDGGIINYNMIFGHGLLLLIVAIDGYIINRTPIRFKQIFFVYLVSLSYTTWTLIHGLATELGNPTTEGDDDGLYSIINWCQRPLPTLLIVVSLHCAVIPILFAFTWGLSAAIPGKYLVEDNSDPEDTEEEC